MADVEMPLHGSGLQDRHLVRVGDTVRRPAGPWTSSVRHLLQSLPSLGFTLAPQALGFDERGREVLSYLPGRDQDWPFPPAITSIEGAANLGRLAASLRTALSRYQCPPNAVWMATQGAPAEGQAIQHGDLGPWNLLWDSEGAVCGVLDWDMAGPGDPWYDTGHLAWFTVPFQDDDRAYERGFAEPPDRDARLEAYATGCQVDAADLVDMVLRTQSEYADRIEFRARANMPGPWRTLMELGVPAKARADHRFTRERFGPPSPMRA